MSWLERSAFAMRAKPLRTFVVAACLPLAGSLAGCIQPLYGTRGPDQPALVSPGASGQTGAALAAIDVSLINGRVGQQLRNELIYRLTGGDKAAPARYRLTITPTEGIQTASADRLSSRSLIDVLVLSANYTLREAGPEGKEILTGSAFTQVSYARDQQRFAAVRAQRDAEDRAASVVAEQIFTRLAAYVATGAK